MSIQRSKKRKQKVEWEERETEMGRNPLSATSMHFNLLYTISLLMTFLLVQIFHIKWKITYLYICKYFWQINY